jgi:hypothetical protein
VFKRFWKWVNERDRVISEAFDRLGDDRAAWREEGPAGYETFIYEVPTSPIIKIKVDLFNYVITVGKKTCIFSKFFLVGQMSDLLYPSEKGTKVPIPFY